MGQIHEAIAAIMADVPNIAKDRKNESQGYKFRGIDDVYIAVHDLFVRHGVFTVPTVIEERTEERTTKNGSALIYRVMKIKYEFFAKDGSSVVATVMGEGMDSGDKASNKAMSVAHKYAIIQILAIPTDDAKDPEIDSHDVAPKRDNVISFHVNLESWITKITLAKDLAELKAVYEQAQAITTGADKEAIIAAKDKRKVELK